MKIPAISALLCTTLTAASLTTTDSSYWSGNYNPNNATSVIPVGGTGPTNIFLTNPYLSVRIQSVETARYGDVSVFVYAGGETTTGISPSYELTRVEASGTAAFSDAITLFTGAIDSGTIAFNLAFPGFGVQNGDIAGATGHFDAGAASAIKQTRLGSFFQTLIIPFTSGALIPIGAFVRADATAVQPNGHSGHSSSTGPEILIQSIQVFDTGGSQLSGYRYTTQSDSTYAFVGGTADPIGSAVGTPVATPEPGSLGLIAIALMASALGRAGKHRLKASSDTAGSWCCRAATHIEHRSLSTYSFRTPSSSGPGELV
jgi:hypothetical protein